MPPSLPLPNLLTAPKASPVPGPSQLCGVSAARAAPADGAPSFKQSLQRLEPKSPQQTAPATHASKHETRSAEAESEASREATPLEAAVPSYLQLHELRQLNHGPSSGLSFLARLAEGVEVQSAATDASGDVTVIDTALVDTLSPLAAVAEIGQSLSNSKLQLPAGTALVAEGDGNTLPLSSSVGLDTAAVSSAQLNSAVATTATVLDAATTSVTLAPGDLKAAGSDFKTLLLQTTTATDGAAVDTAALASDSDATSTLTSSPLFNAAPQSLQLEGRTAVPMSVTFGHAQWSSGLAERTAWLAGQSIQTAEIQLDPPELGPLQIKIHVNQDQASVSFVSANPAVREAVEQTMHRLRELLQEQGMTLVDSGVSDQQPRQQQGSADGDEAGTGRLLGDGSAAVDPALQTLVAPQPWGVDIEV